MFSTILRSPFRAVSVRKLAWILVAVAVICSPSVVQSQVALPREGSAKAISVYSDPEAPWRVARAEDQPLLNIWKILSEAIDNAKQVLLSVRRRLEKEELWPTSFDHAADFVNRTAKAAGKHGGNLATKVQEVGQELGQKVCSTGSNCHHLGQSLSRLASSTVVRKLQLFVDKLMFKGLHVWRERVYPHVQRFVKLALQVIQRAWRIAAPYVRIAGGKIFYVLRSAAEGVLAVSKKITAFIKFCNRYLDKLFRTLSTVARGTAKVIKDTFTGRLIRSQMSKCGRRALLCFQNVRNFIQQVFRVPLRMVLELKAKMPIFSWKGEYRCVWQVQALALKFGFPINSFCNKTTYNKSSRPTATTIDSNKATRTSFLSDQISGFYNLFSLLFGKSGTSKDEKDAQFMRDAAQNLTTHEDSNSPVHGLANTKWFITQQSGSAKKNEDSRYMVLRHGDDIFLLLSLESNGWFRLVKVSCKQSSVIYPSGTIQPADSEGATDLVDILRNNNAEKAIGKLPRSGRKIGNWHFKTAGENLVITNVNFKHESDPPVLVLTADGFAFLGFAGGVKERAGRKIETISQNDAKAEARTILEKNA